MTASRHPLVEELFEYCYDGFWDRSLDSAMELDEQIGDIAAKDGLQELADELDRMVLAAPDSTTAMKTLPSFTMHLPLWEGPDDYRAVLAAARDRVHQALADPSVIPPRPPNDDGLRLPRASRFVDKETAEKACTLVVRRNYVQLKEFGAGTTGWRSMHVYADLRDEIGTVGTVLVNETDAGSQLGLAPGSKHETSCVVMVMSRMVDTGEVFIETSYPELSLDESVRAHFPALCHFYGAWFGQDRDAPVFAMMDACSSTKQPAFSKLTEELDLLLSVVDDDELRRVLEACGSYVLPQSVRHWVERTRWRLDAYDWLPAAPRVRRRWKP